MFSAVIYACIAVSSGLAHRRRSNQPTVYAQSTPVYADPKVSVQMV